MVRAAYRATSARSLRIPTQLVWLADVHVGGHQESSSGLLLCRCHRSAGGMVRTGAAPGISAADTADGAGNLSPGTAFYPVSPDRGGSNPAHTWGSGLGLERDVRHHDAGLVDLGGDLLAGRIGLG